MSATIRETMLASGRSTVSDSINIIIVVYQNPLDEVHALMRTLIDSAEQAGYAAFGTIVVNDDRDVSSGDERVTVHRGLGNVGFANGVAVGVRSGPSDYILIANPDCTVMEDAAIRFFLRLRSTPGILVPVLEKSPGQVDINIYQSWVFTPTRRLSRIVCARFLLQSASSSIPVLVKAPGTFVGMPTRLAKKLDYPFDRSFYLYGEDRDLSIRARRLRVPMTLAREVRVLHPGGGSSEGMTVVVERAKADGMLRVAHRRYGPAGARVMALNLYAEAWLKDRIRGTSLRGPRHWAVERWASAAPAPAAPLDQHEVSAITDYDVAKDL